MNGLDSDLRHAIQTGDYAHARHLIETHRATFAQASPEALTQFTNLLTWAIHSVKAQRAHDAARLAELPQRLRQYRSARDPASTFQVEG